MGSLVIAFLAYILGFIGGCNNRAVTPEEFHVVVEVCSKNGGLKYFNSKVIRCKDGARFTQQK